MSKPPSTPPGREFPSKADAPIVLIVEDEEPIAEALAYVVEEAGYKVLVAPQGRDGLAIALQHRPALILSDLMMPQMGGRELISALRAALDDDAPPVILMTAADVRFTSGAGAEGILKKPFDIEEVERLLRRFLEAG